MLCFLETPVLIFAFLPYYPLKYVFCEYRSGVLAENGLTSRRPATLLKNRLQHKCFPVNFAKLLRIPTYFVEHLSRVWFSAYVAQKMKFSFKYFSSKYDQILSLIRIWSHLTKKFLIKNMWSVKKYFLANFRAILYFYNPQNYFSDGIKVGFFGLK